MHSYRSTSVTDTKNRKILLKYRKKSCEIRDILYNCETPDWMKSGLLLIIGLNEVRINLAITVSGLLGNHVFLNEVF